MKLFSTIVVAGLLTVTAANAQPAQSMKHAKKSTELRQAIFQLMASNMGPMGAMAKGRIPVDAERVATNALRLEQFSYMLNDYFKTDTRKFDVKTEALPKAWEDKATFEEKVNALTKASKNLQAAAKSGDEGKIKKAIGGVGKTCGGCHDVFKKD
ncbi:cytochrome c [Colwellia sp. RSH04]|uniref:c-type cytochrome n=1 Tax=Colwellia sp. RSH04 TaxID=2305464 RepID=UPI000E5976C1|nr:cytochrome c [Colwellia sp. RSH04]RHW76796.1 cytochrome c [Colwellia sp. RSH04]